MVMMKAQLRAQLSGLLTEKHSVLMLVLQKAQLLGQMKEQLLEHQSAQQMVQLKEQQLEHRKEQH